MLANIWFVFCLLWMPVPSCSVLLVYVGCHSLLKHGLNFPYGFLTYLIEVLGRRALFTVGSIAKCGRCPSPRSIINGLICLANPHLLLYLLCLLIVRWFIPALPQRWLIGPHFFHLSTKLFCLPLEWRQVCFLSCIFLGWFQHHVCAVGALIVYRVVENVSTRLFVLQRKRLSLVHA